MAEPLSSPRALAILYDLALTVGGEIALEPLLTKTLQRLMYHTGFPLGLALCHEAPRADDGLVDVQLSVVIGDYALLKRKGDHAAIPLALVDGAGLADLPETLLRLGTRRPQRFVLRLPVVGFGTILLIGPGAPPEASAFADLFAPIMNRLATAILLCRSREHEIKQRLERAAHYDALTDLPNALLFADTLREAMIEAERVSLMVAVVSMDIDEFKALDARIGDTAGNRVIAEFGKRLEDACHGGDLAARLAGDEFALLLVNVRAWDEVQPRVAAMLGAATAPMMVDGHEVRLSVSAGVSVFPGDARDADLLMRNARHAMYQAKEEARGTLHFFDAKQDRRARERQWAIKRVETALAAGQMQLFYQPQVDLLSGRVVGVEALLRWFDPERGIVPPDQFLPLIDGGELMVHIGNWVMRQALAQAVEWRGQGFETRISVNIAGCHLQRPDFVEQVGLALASVPGARPADLEIEILESSAIDNFAHVREVIEACRGLGVSFALDDFGTGYSSLGYLRQLPTAAVKIDQVFVRNLFEEFEAPQIVQAIVQIAKIFKRRLIAEGVESYDHALLLICMGCDIAQGFGIARPLPAELVLPWVKACPVPPEIEHWRDIKWDPAFYYLFSEIHRHRRQWDGVFQALRAARRGEGYQGLGMAGDRCGLGEWLGSYLGRHCDGDLAAAHQRFHGLIDEVDQMLHGGDVERAELAASGLEDAFAAILRSVAAVLKARV